MNKDLKNLNIIFINYFFLIVCIFIINARMYATTEISENNPKNIPVQTAQPNEGQIYSIAIIGAGAAGTMAAKRAILNDDEILWFAGAKKERRNSRGNWVRKIENIPGFERYTRAILELRNETMLELAMSPFSHHLFIIEESIMNIQKNNDYFELTDGLGRLYRAKYVVMATGMMDEQPHINDSINPVLKYANGQTINYCALCDGHRSYLKKTVVIGHSEAALSLAILLKDKYKCSSMTILTNGKQAEANEELLSELEAKDIEILEYPIIEVLGNQEEKQLTGFKLDNQDEEENEIEVEAETAFIALGVRPNNQLALQLGAEVDEKGLVITDAKGESSVENLFIAGDLRSNSMKQVYTAWQHAVESVQLINKRLRDELQQ